MSTCMAMPTNLCVHFAFMCTQEGGRLLRELRRETADAAFLGIPIASVFLEAILPQHLVVQLVCTPREWGGRVVRCFWVRSPWRVAHCGRVVVWMCVQGVRCACNWANQDCRLLLQECFETGHSLVCIWLLMLSFEVGDDVKLGLRHPSAVLHLCSRMWALCVCSLTRWGGRNRV
ncbi:unnamed protein product [Ostreobium quekettii]|uniref:Uncharacterized protein n=1 Tax=Ostreobium quekettii TaxID=121088 RepID=A0A8S1IW41_9CHLO|nr:unnamed protein product [Ostreobium quekettii]